MIEGTSGKLFGTTSAWAPLDDGTVFCINKNGSGFNTLHIFDDDVRSDGGNPFGELLIIPNDLTPQIQSFTSARAIFLLAGPTRTSAIPEGLWEMFVITKTNTT